mmetsp:Transcript_8098/g.14668  ORF Transcript_8098/g.14668 Transcript_8098/m.14668 type:complete len:264 (-) Transcript_8098:361-1152(-)
MLMLVFLICHLVISAMRFSSASSSSTVRGTPEIGQTLPLVLSQSSMVSLSNTTPPGVLTGSFIRCPLMLHPNSGGTPVAWLKYLLGVILLLSRPPFFGIVFSSSCFLFFIFSGSSRSKLMNSCAPALLPLLPSRLGRSPNSPISFSFLRCSFLLAFFLALRFSFFLRLSSSSVTSFLASSSPRSSPSLLSATIPSAPPSAPSPILLMTSLLLSLASALSLFLNMSSSMVAPIKLDAPAAPSAPMRYSFCEADAPPSSMLFTAE